MNNAYNELNNLMNDYIEEGVFPGATYGLCNSEQTIEGCTGYKALYPQKEINDIDTLYDMASLTKVIVTNTILSRALQANLISLTDNVGKYLPKYNYLDITIYDLVTHQSGLPADFDIPNIHCNADFEKQLNDLKLEYKTGTDVIYSDQGFVLLGLVLEQVYGKSLDKISQEEIFNPLEMNNSTFYPKDINKCAPTELTQERGIVRGKTHDEKAYYYDKIVGHAGLFCDVKDVEKFAQMVLNDGYVNGKQYLDKQYIDMWFATQVVDKTNRQRSIGWIVGPNNLTGDDCSENVISHAGFTGTSIVIDRDKNIGIVVLSNRIHPTRTNRKLVENRKVITQTVYNGLEQTKRL